MERPKQNEDKFSLARERFIEGVEEIVTDKNWSKGWQDPDEILRKLRDGVSGWASCCLRGGF